MTIVNGKNYIGGSGSHQTLLGTTGDDWIDGGGGNDFVDGRSGNDDVLGGAANDTVIGDTGDDHVSGNADNDLVVGMAGMDFVFGDDGDDFVSGGDGNDYIETNEGIDRYADGGVGNDFIAFVADFGTASLADYQASSHEYAFNGARGGVGKDIVRGVETVGFLSGGTDSDIIDGRLAASTPYVLAAGQIRSQSLRLLGGAGNDIILGGKLNNAFFGEQDAAPISALDDWAVDGVISPGSGSFGFFTNWGITSSASDPVAGAVSGASNADEDIFVIGANIRYNATSTHYDTIIDFDVSKDKIDISSTRTSEEEALASVVSVSGGHCQFTVTTRFNDTRIVVLEGVTKSEFEQYFEAVFSVGNSAAISDNAGSSSSSTINSINNTHLPIPSFNRPLK